VAKKNPSRAAAAAAAVSAGNAATSKAKPKPAAGPHKGGPPQPTVHAGPATATAPGAPAAPPPVSPFLTSGDFDAINSFYTDLNTKLGDIKATVGTFDPTTGTWSGGTEQADTEFQTAQTDKAAKANTGAAQDDAAARGIFQSSIKDATLYDIEAQRSLSDKFLNDKLTADRLAAGTNMQILANSKAAFDKNYGSVDANGNPIFGRRAFENAQGVNDTNGSAYAAALAAWKTAHPGATVASATAAPGGSAAPAGAARKGVTRPLNAPSIAVGRDSRGNLLPGTSVKTNKKNKTQTYYGGVTTA
jgi:hypothetical protein